MRKLLPVVLLIFVSLLLAGIFLSQKTKPAAYVSNFDECTAAGYPVAESYPPTCRTPDGKVFTQDIGNELEKQDQIRIDEPRPNMIIKSPLTVKGEARGTWFFEGSFPVKLLAENGTELGRATATAEGEWMTENFVPFTAEITFSSIGKGKLVLEKDNPSGLAEHADSLVVPVLFAESEAQQIKLYYYNSGNDPNATCSADAVVGVNRSIPKTVTPVKDSLTLLLKGELTAREKADGFTSEFPLSGVELISANLKEGVLTLEFSDPQGKTGGGSCRVGLLWAQIEKTAKQFAGIREVRFLPEELFQP